MSNQTAYNSINYLIRGEDFLKREPDFKLVGRTAELERLNGILIRERANSVLLVGAGGVGCTAICMGLQALKNDPEAPFDIAAKRLFWLDIDGLFSSGDPAQIDDGFQRALQTLLHASDTVLLIEDVKNFIEGARNSGCTHLINALIREVKNNRLQAILECRDDHLEVVLKIHSDITELFTLIEIQEPEGPALAAIVEATAPKLSRYHGIRISPEALQLAMTQTSKYRVSDLGLSRAQPERTVTLLDRALTSYRLESHVTPPQLKRLQQQLTAAADNLSEASATAKAISEFQEQWAKQKAEIRKLTQEQKLGEDGLREIEIAIESQILSEKNARANLTSDSDTTVALKTPGSFSVMNAGFESSAVKKLRAEFELLQTKVTENKHKYAELSETINGDLLLVAEHVLAEFSKISGIPVSKLNQDERLKLLGLRENLAGRVFGQNEAVSKLANAVCVARAGLQDPSKPQASFLFLGPSGVGKTEIAKALTLALMDDERALLRFDMSEYMEKHAVAKLIGAPPGYEGYEAGGILTNALRKNPNRIILFDEIEKAHPDMFNVFLQILDDARLTDNRGLTVSFRDTVIIMTTNIGTTHFLNESLAGAEAADLALADLAAQYRPEFLNRFNGRRNIVCFNRLNLEVIEKIATREIKKLNQMIASKSARLQVKMTTDDLIAMCKTCYEPINGARGVIGYIADIIKPVIADTLLKSPDAAGEIVIKFNRQSKTVEVEPLTANSAPT